MALKFEISKEDILRSKVLKPGWYVVEIKDITEEQSKSDGESMNTVVKHSVISGPKLVDGSEPAGVPITMWFSEKFKGEAAISFAEALAGKKITEGASIDLENAKGKKIKAHVVNQEYKGKATNTIDGYATLNA